MNETSKVLLRVFESPNVADYNGEPANIVDVIDKLAVSLSCALGNLGHSNASTDMGAIEAHGLAVIKAGEAIASAINNLAEAVNQLVAGK